MRIAQAKKGKQKQPSKKLEKHLFVTASTSNPFKALSSLDGDSDISEAGLNKVNDLILNQINPSIRTGVGEVLGASAPPEPVVDESSRLEC